MEANDLHGVANLDPRGMVGMIYVGDCPSLLYTEYTSCGPHGYRKEDLKKNPIISLCELLISRGVTSLHPRGLISRIYVGYH